MKTDKLSMRNNLKDRHISTYWLDPLYILSGVIKRHSGFSLDLDDHKNKWSHHKYFLYGYDQSPDRHDSKSES